MAAKRPSEGPIISMESRYEAAWSCKGTNVRHSREEAKSGNCIAIGPVSQLHQLSTIIGFLFLTNLPVRFRFGRRQLPVFFGLGGTWPRACMRKRFRKAVITWASCTRQGLMKYLRS